MKTLFEWLVFPFVALIMTYCAVKFMAREFYLYHWKGYDNSCNRPEER